MRTARRFDVDDVRPVLGEQLAVIGRRNGAAEIENTNARKGATIVQRNSAPTLVHPMYRTRTTRLVTLQILRASGKKTR